MKNFNLNRFGHVVRLDVQQNRRRYLKYLAACYLACLLVELLVFYKPSRHGADLVAAMLHTAANSFIAIQFWAMLAGASALFENLNTKGGRQAELTLPATNAEKFLSRYLLSTVGFLALFLTGFVAADLTRMAVFPMLGHSFPSAVPVVFETLFGRSDSLITINGEAVSRALYVQVHLVATLSMILTHACYLVGSALLRKNAFVLTSLALFVLAVAAGWVTVELAGARFELFTSVDDTWQLACLNAVLFVLIVGCYWLTWRRFCRIQVITRKWWRP